MVKVYLASWYSSRAIMKTRAEELRAQGIEVTSRWVEETINASHKQSDIAGDYLRETARIDIEDVLKANIVVLNVPEPNDFEYFKIDTASWARGGRHFEAGFQYATMVLAEFLPTYIQARGKRRLILVGHKENVFHYLDGLSQTADSMHLPAIQLFETWEEAKEFLIELAHQAKKVHIN